MGIISFSNNRFLLFSVRNIFVGFRNLFCDIRNTFANSHFLLQITPDPFPQRLVFARPKFYEVQG